MISIEELLEPVTTDQQLEKFLTTLEAVGVHAKAWRKAGSLRTILRIVAATYAGFSQAILGFTRAGFLETAEKGWLTLLAFNSYGVTRIPATFATGPVTLVNAGGGNYPVQADELRLISEANGGKGYTNTTAFTLAPGATITIDVLAIEVGSASSAPPGTITKLETVLPGVTATNALAVVGADEETDTDLRQRCKDKLATISGKGPRGAYGFAVRSAVRDDGSPVDVNRLRVSPGSSTGVVTVYVASPAGAPIGSDLPFIETAIETYARPDAVTAILLPAVPVPYARSLTVWARRIDGLTAADLGTLVSRALIDLIATYPIGGIAKPPSTQGYLYADRIAGTVQSAHAAIFDVDGAGADIALAPNEVATLAATLDVRLVEVST